MDKPKVVCLCGSTRFSKAFHDANLQETLDGNIILSIGCNMRSDAEIFADYAPDQLERIKARLDELHLRKIDMADEVLILNVDGYIGESTKRELEYAKSHGKKIRFLEPDKVEPTQEEPELQWYYRKHGADTSDGIELVIQVEATLSWNLKRVVGYEWYAYMLNGPEPEEHKLFAGSTAQHLNKPFKTRKEAIADANDWYQWYKEEEKDK